MLRSGDLEIIMVTELMDSVSGEPKASQESLIFLFHN